jgi:hypothetical protein
MGVCRAGVNGPKGLRNIDAENIISYLCIGGLGLWHILGEIQKTELAEVVDVEALDNSDTMVQSTGIASHEVNSKSRRN